MVHGMIGCVHTLLRVMCNSEYLHVGSCTVHNRTIYVVVMQGKRGKRHIIKFQYMQSTDKLYINDVVRKKAIKCCQPRTRGEEKNLQRFRKTRQGNKKRKEKKGLD